MDVKRSISDGSSRIRARSSRVGRRRGSSSGDVGARRRPPLAILSLSVIGAACLGTDGAAPIPGSTLSDSAGVTIVTNEAPQPGSRLPWVLGEEPLLTIGTMSGAPEEELFEVGDALLLEDGRLLVANGGSGEVRVFSSDGGYLEAWGRAGEGPGEFEQPRDLFHWPGDSIAVWDFGLRRLTVFDRSGALGRTFPLRMSSGLPAGTVHVFPDGSTLASRPNSLPAPEPPLESLYPRVFEYARLSTVSDALADYGLHPAGEIYLRPDEMAVMTHPFERLAHSAVWNGLATVGASVRYELKLFGPDGSLERLVRRDHDLVPVTEADLGAHLASRLDEMESERRARMEHLYEGFPLVETFPAFGGVEVDAAGHLWVMEYARPNDPTSIWSVFDEDGRIQGFVQLPDGFEVLEIGVDYLLGLVTDDFDIEYVHMLSLDRGAA